MEFYFNLKKLLLQAATSGMEAASYWLGKNWINKRTHACIPSGLLGQDVGKGLMYVEGCETASKSPQHP